MVPIILQILHGTSLKLASSRNHIIGLFLYHFLVYLHNAFPESTRSNSLVQ